VLVPKVLFGNRFGCEPEVRLQLPAWQAGVPKLSLGTRGEMSLGTRGEMSLGTRGEMSLGTRGEISLGTRGNVELNYKH
jgi:hypothetical protein